MQTIDLNGTWNLRYCDPGVGEQANWPSSLAEEEGTFAAQVPGDVHLDMMQAGIIDEPLYGRNALDCRWMEGKDWWYSRTFEVPRGFIGNKVELYFGGLDTTADIWINGRHVGAHNNMFVPYTLNVTDDLHEGRNSIVVRLDVGLRAAEKRPLEPYNKLVSHDADVPRWWVRKAQFTFGWDWAPRLLTCGIWRGVELRSYETVALQDVCLRTELQPDGSARVRGWLELENVTERERSVNISVSLSGHGEHDVSLQAALRPGLQTIETQIDLPSPALWWPASLGEPNLYDCRVIVEGDEQVADQRTFRYGLREVKLLREPLPDEGESFTLAVNGQKVFCKGADWVPADSIIACVNPGKYRELVRLAAAANFNMFRIWGGGIYEDPYFYDLCDEFGILVWQDFLYACSYYPDDHPDFVAEARREAELAVKQLRNHACIALWCGNNENQWIHYQHVQAGTAADRCYGQIIYEQVLPDVCAKLDQTRPYWPSSPYGGDDPNSEMQGNRHAWYLSIQNTVPERRADYQNYAADRAKFVCEFGILAPPNRESLEQFLPPGEIAPSSESWQFHNNIFERGITQLALKKYWKPAEELNLSEYIRYAQLIQAEALKFALEHWRRRKFTTSGALFWMYSDSWGGVGWTIVDYYLRKKASYYFVRRVFRPVLISVQQENRQLTFWLTNDTLQEMTGTFEYGLVQLSTSSIQRHTLEVKAEPNASQQVAELNVPEEVAVESGRWMAYCRFIVDGQVVCFNRHFLVGFHLNALNLPQASFTQQLDGDVLVLQAETFTWQVRIEVPRGVEVDDNYFDLLPGEERRISLSGPKELFRQVQVSALN